MTLRDRMRQSYPNDVLSNGKVLGCPCNVPEIFAESDLQEREWEFECPRKEDGNDMTCTECWNREYKGE